MLWMANQKREQINRKKDFLKILQMTEVNIESAMDDMKKTNFLKETNRFFKTRVLEKDQFIKQMNKVNEIRDIPSNKNLEIIHLFKLDEKTKELHDELEELVKEVKDEKLRAKIAVLQKMRRNDFQHDSSFSKK